MTNGFNQRCGFVTSDRDEDEEIRNTRRAIEAMNRRLEHPTGKPRLSEELITCNLIQVVGKFITRDAEACALGAIHLGAGGGIKDDCINWPMVTKHYDIYDAEWYREVKCPECNRDHSIASMIYHLNDVHESCNYDIGIFLEKYNL